MEYHPKAISDNQRTWDVVADLFLDASALPIWGPFGIGGDLNLVPEVQGKTFLEVCCGSGRSMRYLTELGAKRVYGLDVSQKQLNEVAAYNHEALRHGRITLMHSPMEQRIDIEPVDIAFSIYGIGWTPEPERTLQNIYSYLKPGGLFIWSWDHTFFTDVKYEDGVLKLVYSYHDENPVVLKDWKREGTNAHVTYRKTSTWFQLLRKAGFEVIGYHEPKPKNLDRGFDDPKKYYSIQKAEKVPATFIFVCKKPS